jgi:hypothetical protein
MYVFPSPPTCGCTDRSPLLYILTLLSKNLTQVIDMQTHLSHYWLEKML